MTLTTLLVGGESGSQVPVSGSSQWHKQKMYSDANPAMVWVDWMWGMGGHGIKKKINQVFYFRNHVE